MRDLDDLVRYENESTTLDFKAIQYTKDQHDALIKDVMAMANADTKDDRFILLGVKHAANGQRQVIGIPSEIFIDPSTYQQLIRENIEPPIEIDYSPHKIDGKLVGVIRISTCSQQPYLMKKDFGSLRRGDGFIRKGTHQLRLDRRDLDRIYQHRQSGFDGTLRVTFSGSDQRETRLSALRDYVRPSQRAANRIKSILDQRAGIEPGSPQERLIELRRLMSSPLTPVPYQDRTNNELVEALTTIEEDYKIDDEYDFFERRASKINLRLLNEGHHYIERASVRLMIQPTEGLYVAQSLYAPPRPSGILAMSVPPINLPYSDYPEVRISNEGIHVFEDIGDIRHGIPTDAFKESLRIVLTEEAIGKTLSLRYEILAKNLQTPLSEDLRICVV